MVDKLHDTSARGGPAVCCVQLEPVERPGE